MKQKRLLHCFKHSEKRTASSLKKHKVSFQAKGLRRQTGINAKYSNKLLVFGHGPNFFEMTEKD